MKMAQVSKTVKYYAPDGTSHDYNLNVNAVNLWLGKPDGSDSKACGFVVKAERVIGAKVTAGMRSNLYGASLPDVTITVLNPDGRVGTRTFAALGVRKGGAAEALVTAINAMAKGVAPTPVATAPTATATPGGFCSGCGAANNGGAFCSGCGAKR